MLTCELGLMHVGGIGVALGYVVKLEFVRRFSFV